MPVTARLELLLDATSTVGPVVIHFGRLGDTILLSSLLQVLHARYERPCALIGAAPWCREVFRHHHAVVRTCGVMRHTPFPWSSGWWDAVRLLREAPRSPVYICETEPRRLRRIGALLALAGVPRSRCLFFSDDAGAETHWVERWLQFGGRTPRGAGVVPQASVPVCDTAAPRLCVSDEERAVRDVWLSERGWSGRRLVLIQPGNRLIMRRRRSQAATSDSKAWPLERWTALLERVHARVPDAVVLLCGAPEEIRYLNAIRAATAGPGETAVATPRLRALFALCEVAHSMISVDSGPGHAAAALGVPLVVLFGRNAAGQWLPRGPTAAAVVGLGGPPHLTRVDQIEVDAVFNAWCTLPQRTRSLDAAAEPPR
jgi:ADP-heptose:LPS heptosyltransferase